MMSKFIINTSWLLVMIAISGLIYVRFSAHDTALVHVMPPTGATTDSPVINEGSASFLYLSENKPESLWDNISSVVLSTPRTQKIAGSEKSGMITYVTRTRVFGFPDYTTILVSQNAEKTQVRMFGRLRFGRSDFGVNAARLKGWVLALKALDQPG